MSQGEQEVSAFVARLGLTPISASDFPHVRHLMNVSSGLRRVRETPAYLGLLARYERGEIDGHACLREVDALIDALPPESA